jgi:predicted nuclease of predicted toxin-antitoxin system
MRFLVDEDLSRSTCALLREYGHTAYDVRDIGYRGSPDSEIAAYAQRERLCIVTGDFGFADIGNYPPGEYAGLGILKLSRTATASAILQWLESLVRQEELVDTLPGKLAIVETGRVRVRTS